MNKKKQKVIVGLSGGVDSSMTAVLLQREGYEVEGIYMKLHNAVAGYHEKNLHHIQNVTEFLGIKYHILDLSSEFQQEVYDYFVQDYIDGNTPNPCVKCNKNIKFGKLYEKAMELGADFLATGHYASTDGEFIYQASDKTKDQSYFLGQVPQKVLSKLLFPMAKYEKEYIKTEASKIPQLLSIASQKESQEICFVDTVYTDILKKHTQIDQEGKTLDKDGKVVGHHKGYMHYTIGKRRGFYVHGAHDPHFVLKTDKKNNTITVGKKEDLAIKKVQINGLNMFIDDKEFICYVKLRFRSQTVKCDCIIKDDTGYISLYEPVYGVAVGQVAVFYDDEKLLGSGWITQTNYIGS